MSNIKKKINNLGLFISVYYPIKSFVCIIDMVALNNF